MSANADRAGKGKLRAPFLMRVLLALTAAAPGLLGQMARRAHSRQGADPARLAERFGRATLARPLGRLAWIHAASVGEAVSVVTLAREIEARTGASLLVTTSSTTGGQTAARHLPEAMHQFLPVDTPAAVGRFLAHWKPDAAFFVEGDLWPRMITQLARSDTPMALLNARASRSRRRFPRSFGALLAPMALVTVQDEALRAEFVALGLTPERVQCPGNLKADIAPLPVDTARRAQIAQAAKGRWIWAAVSTHMGEDEIVLDAHEQLPGTPLLLLVPRHPVRGEALAALLTRRGFRFTRQGSGDMPGPQTQVHLVDLLGETGVVYAAAGIALIGGSLLQGPGGHTPFEPAALGCAVISGPHVENFAASYDDLRRAGAAREVRNAQDLSATIATLASDAEALAKMQQAARAEQRRQSGAVRRTMGLIDQILNWDEAVGERPTSGA